jgi:hypothetical protein
LLGRRLRRLGPVLAVALPAAAAVAVVLLTGGSAMQAGAADGRSAAGLARAAAIQDAERPARAPQRRRPASPRWISIPAAGVSARVESVAARRGVLRVPAVGVAGWYRGGPRPGEAGRAVIIGHLDTKTGPGLFARVSRLLPGATVSVTDARGDVWSYDIVGAAQVDKDDFPAEEVYGGSASPVLVLITCGGPFSEEEGYRDNVLVYARPV